MGHLQYMHMHMHRHEHDANACECKSSLQPCASVAINTYGIVRASSEPLLACMFAAVCRTLPLPTHLG
jgi:hypothetical protein